jgi:hypothetical protein
MTCFEITIGELFNCYQTLKGLEEAYDDKDVKDFSIGNTGVKYKRQDCKLLRIFVLKFIDILEAYNVNTSKDTKIYNEKFKKDLHVYRMNEMFEVFKDVFGKVQADN